jgi:hypothetical protein
MGGLDGVKFSKCYVFNQFLGWKGVLVEASPRNYEKLVVNRPDELATVHVGVCAESQDLHWVEARTDATGGFTEFASKEFQAFWFTKEGIKNAEVV